MRRTEENPIIFKRNLLDWLITDVLFFGYVFIIC